eukprot:TRINITY_DN11139_c0_g3_i2.p1 TRINITY_DN11139_c0_g3~~TRINITY_DN11139_c0_g3_i2.p1  ORF type:complete len:124 (-),score=13.58 TRINITY_DN11139_c0_g3_i2:11-382(-)
MCIRDRKIYHFVIKYLRRFPLRCFPTVEFTNKSIRERYLGCKDYVIAQRLKLGEAREQSRQGVVTSAKDFAKIYMELANQCSDYLNGNFLKHIAVSTPVSMNCLLYTSPSPRDRQKSRMPSSA